MPQSFDPTLKPMPKNSIFQEIVGDTLFLCDENSAEQVHSLNSGAAVVWLLCDGERSIEQITAEIATAYALPYLDTQQQVIAALEQFQQLGLMRT